MLGLAFETALRSIVKTPGVSLLVIMAIALGIGITMPMVALYYNASGNPLPEVGDKVYRVLIDNWLLDQPFRFNSPEMPTEWLAARDIRALMQSDIPTKFSASYSGQEFVRSAEGNLAVKPFYSAFRATTRDFFDMFQIPFRYGAPWDSNADQETTNIAVISHSTNQSLFGGGDNVGENFKIGNQIYTIVGITEPWALIPRVYDMGPNNARPEGVFIPLSNFQRSHLKPFAFASLEQTTIETFGQEFLNSETIFAILWVQLETADQVLAYRDFLDNYVSEQKSLGRLQKPSNNRIYSATQWVDVAPANVGAQDLYSAFIIVGIFFLLVCLLNLLSLLLSKFLSVTPQACVTRALGATRAVIFSQYVIEVMLLGTVGGLLSIYISKTVLAAMQWVYLENLPREYKQIQMQGDDTLYVQFDTNLLIITMVLTLFASLLSALYPAWRACRVAPAEHLKMN